MAYSLGIDASTQSISAIVLNLDDNEILCECSVNFGENLPKYNAPNGFINGNATGEIFADPLMWLDALDILFEKLQLICDLNKITSISGAGQQHGSVYLNDKWIKTCENLDPKSSLSEQIAPCLSRKYSPIWMDKSTTQECQEITHSLGGNREICRKSGSVAIERFSGPQIRRFYKNHLEDYPQTKRIHLVSSFICSIIAGKDSAIDTGDGAGMNLMNIDSNTWDVDLLKATAPGLLDRLPNISQGNTIIGCVSGYFVRKFNLNSEAEVVIFTGDNPSSLVGMASSSPGKKVISLGTSDTFFAAMPETLSDPNGFGHVFGNPSGGSMSLQCFLNGSLAREEVRKKYKFSWEDFNQAIKETSPGSNGNYMLPFFSPEISPLYDGQNPILEGTKSFENWSNPKLAIRACLEGQFLNMKIHTKWMKSNTSTIYVTGGASQNNTILQIISDIFQSDIKKSEVTGSVALGAAMRAAQHCMKIDLSILENNFCRFSNDVINPNVDNENIYLEAESNIKTLLLTI